MKTEKKQNYIEITRVIAVILVIFNHTDLTGVFYHNTANIFTYMVSVFTTIIVKIDVPLFFCISGALLLNRKEGILEIFRKRILRILLVTILFSFIRYVSLHMQGLITEVSIWNFCFRFILGDIQISYWFLYAYLAFLILLPLIKRMVTGITIQEFCVLTCVVLFLEIYGWVRNYVWFGINEDFIDVLQPVSGYIYYWISGFFVIQYADTIKENLKKISFVSVIIVFIEIIIPFGLSLLYFKDASYLDSIIYKTSYILPVIVFIYIKIIVDKIDAFGNSKLLGEIVKLGKYSFAIYLIEQYLRIFWLPFILNMDSKIPGVVNSFIYVALTYISSLLVAIVMKKIPGIRSLV